VGTDSSPELGDGQSGPVAPSRREKRLKIITPTAADDESESIPTTVAPSSLTRHQQAQNRRRPLMKSG